MQTVGPKSPSLERSADLARMARGILTLGYLWTKIEGILSSVHIRRQWVNVVMNGDKPS